MRSLPSNCWYCYLTTFISHLLDLLQHHHYLGAVVLVKGSQELGQEDHYNGPVRIFPNHRHDSHLLYHLKLHLHLGAAAAVLCQNWDRKTITVHRKPAQPSENLDCNAIDEPEKVEMKAEKLPKIKLRSLPTAANASPFFPLLLAVLKRYSFPCFIFQWLYSRSINTAVLSAE